MFGAKKLTAAPWVAFDFLMILLRYDPLLTMLLTDDVLSRIIVT